MGFDRIKRRMQKKFFKRMDKDRKRAKLLNKGEGTGKDQREKSSPERFCKQEGGLKGSEISK